MLNAERLGRVGAGPFHASLARLWRFGFVLCQQNDTAIRLVELTIRPLSWQAIDHRTNAHVDRFLLKRLYCIWLYECDSAVNTCSPGTIVSPISLAISDMDKSGQFLQRVLEMPLGPRIALFLVCVEGLTYAETAQFLDVSYSTISSRLVLARRMLAPHVVALKPQH